MRDNLSGLLNDDIITNIEAQSFDLICIVQASPLDPSACKVNRPQLSHRSQGAHSTHLHCNANKLSDLLLRWELVGCRPVWRTVIETKLSLKFKVIDLKHQAINVKFLVKVVFVVADDLIYLSEIP